MTKYRVNLALNVGYTAIVEADSEAEALEQVKTLAESDISNVGDEIDYVDTDDICSQVEIEDE